MICVKCGAELPNDARFCGNCGTIIASANNGAQWNGSMPFDSKASQEAQDEDDSEERTVFFGGAEPTDVNGMFASPQHGGTVFMQDPGYDDGDSESQTVFLNAGQQYQGGAPFQTGMPNIPVSALKPQKAPKHPKTPKAPRSAQGKENDRGSFEDSNVGISLRGKIIIGVAVAAIIALVIYMIIGG